MDDVLQVFKISKKVKKVLQRLFNLAFFCMFVGITSSEELKSKKSTKQGRSEISGGLTAAHFLTFAQGVIVQLVVLVQRGSTSFGSLWCVPMWCLRMEKN